MSSLAGALDAFIPSQPSPLVKNEENLIISVPEDVGMHSLDTKQLEGHVQKEEPDERMTDLFGNDDVEDSKPPEGAASPAASGPDSDMLLSPERERRQALEYGEEDIPTEIAIEVKEAEVSFPNIPVPKSSDGDNWVIRMPNFVKVDSKPFHPDTYIGPEHEDEEAQQAESLRERSMTIKLKVENTVRWRWIRDERGRDRRQSNSRIIRWSDGTLSLRLGKELFDINQSLDTSASVARQSLGSQPPSSQPITSQSQTDVSSSRLQGLTYLVAQHKRSQVLQSEAVITGYMSIRPTGMQSETHRMLVRAVGQKHNKVARLRMAPDPTMDPEREKMELMKQTAKKSKKKTDTEDGFGGGKKKRYSRKTADHDMWSDDDDRAPVYAASDEADDDGGGVENSGRKAKRKFATDDKKDHEDYQEDDFVVADSSDDDGGLRGFSKNHDQDDIEEDPLDRLDAKIRAQQDAKKRRHRESGSPTKGPAEDDTEPAHQRDEDMDVESEEEEDEDEELKVRRTGKIRTRNRAAITFDEDDE